MLRDLENIVRDFLMPHWTTVDNNHVAVMTELLMQYQLYKVVPFSFPAFPSWLSWHNDERLIGAWRNESEIDITY